jgi:hypothetical protein
MTSFNLRWPIVDVWSGPPHFHRQSAWSLLTLCTTGTTTLALMPNPCSLDSNSSWIMRRLPTRSSMPSGCFIQVELFQRKSSPVAGHHGDVARPVDLPNWSRCVTIRGIAMGGAVGANTEQYRCIDVAVFLFLAVTTDGTRILTHVFLPLLRRVSLMRQHAVNPFAHRVPTSEQSGRCHGSAIRSG